MSAISSSWLWNVQTSLQLPLQSAARRTQASRGNSAVADDEDESEAGGAAVQDTRVQMEEDEDLTPSEDRGQHAHEQPRRRARMIPRNSERRLLDILA